MKERFEGIASAAARKPVLTLGIIAVLALVGALLALQMQPDAGTDTFVSNSTSSAQATADDHQHFGGDAVVILVREPLTDLVETKDLAIVSQLEACLAGQTIVAAAARRSRPPRPTSIPTAAGGAPAEGCARPTQSRWSMARARS